MFLKQLKANLDAEFILKLSKSSRLSLHVVTFMPRGMRGIITKENIPMPPVAKLRLENDLGSQSGIFCANNLKMYFKNNFDFVKTFHCALQF